MSFVPPTGLPAQTGHLKLELTVTYNTLLFSLSCGTPEETNDCINDILIRGKASYLLQQKNNVQMGIMFLNTLCSLLWFLALEAVCKQVPSYDLVPLWQVVLKTFGGTVYEPWIHKLLLIQWAVWLSECHYEGILHLLLQVNHKVCIFYFFL